MIRRGVLCVGLALGALGCLRRPLAEPEPNLQSGVRIPIARPSVNVDVLFEIDNSNSMRENQSELARQFRVLIDELVNPPRVDGLPIHPAVTSLHVAVLSSDLGTPGREDPLPSCSNPDLGDNGLFNPIARGAALASHLPWVSDGSDAGLPPDRPSRCMNRQDQYPNFLTFDATSTNREAFRDDFVCNAFLNASGCNFEQQLESVYRALVVHDARATPGNGSPNAGFLREDSVLAIVVISDEEDGSVRDCRFPERDAMGRPRPCDDALAVYRDDGGDDRWAPFEGDPERLNRRFYRYTPGSRQDPTWPLERYIDLSDPRRGFLGLKPDHPERVVFAAIGGFPTSIPTRADGAVDWTSLLGASADGRDAFQQATPEGPVSMRLGPEAEDPQCTARVVPACRRWLPGREGTDPCQAANQYVALPARRIAEVARRFDAGYNNATVSSICRVPYGDALRQIVQRIQNRLVGRCLVRPLDTFPPPCDRVPQGESCALPGQPVTVRCVVRETLPAGLSCEPGHGRDGVGRTVDGRNICLVRQVEVVPGMGPAARDAMGNAPHGFFYDTRPDATMCPYRVSFTTNDGLPEGATADVECVQAGRVPQGRDR
ncbi:MAG: hypothetical protein HY909_17785 [Deltaproteobacteria bacterium]|nr:hypothetical protein [Deltaproteobacteria bacterium]